MEVSGFLFLFVIWNHTIFQLVSGDINEKIALISAGGNASWLAVNAKVILPVFFNKVLLDKKFTQLK